MSWSDALKNAVGGLVTEAEQNLAAKYLTKENLQVILAKLQEAGLGQQVQSWIDKNKQNIPITADEIRAALGDEHVKQLAQSWGISPDTLATIIAAILPHAAAAAGPAAAPATPGQSAAPSQ